MGTTFEKIYNYSGKCATPSNKIGGQFLSYELLRKAKKLNLPSLVYRRARGDMIEIFKHFHSYDNCTLPENFRPRNRPSRKHDYQLVWKAPKDGVRGLQANFFYFQIIKTWNELPKEIVLAKSIDSFKNKLHEAWKDMPIKFYEQERFIEAQIYLRILITVTVLMTIIMNNNYDNNNDNNSKDNVNQNSNYIYYFPCFSFYQEKTFYLVFISIRIAVSFKGYVPNM